MNKELLEKIIDDHLLLAESLKKLYLQYTGIEYKPPNFSNLAKYKNFGKIDKPEEKNKSFNPNCLACMEQRLHTEEDWNNHPGQGRSGQEGKYSR